jgi:hypothetical protein
MLESGGTPIDVGQAVGQLQAQPDARVACLKFVQPGQHHVAPEIGRHRDLQLAFNVVLAGAHLAHLFLRFAQSIQQSFTAPEQALAGQRQAHAARAADEQRRAKVRFQPFQTGAGNRRRGLQQARGGRQAALLGGGDKGFKILQVPNFHCGIFKGFLKLIPGLRSLSKRASWSEWHPSIQ